MRGKYVFILYSCMYIALVLDKQCVIFLSKCVSFIINSYI